MTEFETLETEASELGISVLTENIPVEGMGAVYFREPSGAPIVILEPLSNSEKTCNLAEELGHHYTGTDHILRYDSIQDWKAEARARRWAHDKLLSPDAIRTAARNASDIYDLAEALDVTEAFLREAIEDYQRRGLWAV